MGEASVFFLGGGHRAGSQATVAPPCGSWGAAGGWRSHSTLPAGAVLTSSCLMFPPAVFLNLLCSPLLCPKSAPFPGFHKIPLRWGLEICEEGLSMGGLRPLPSIFLSQLPSLSEVRGSGRPHLGHSHSDHSRTSTNSFLPCNVNSCRMRCGATRTVVTFAHALPRAPLCLQLRYRGYVLHPQQQS